MRHRLKPLKVKISSRGHPQRLPPPKIATRSAIAGYSAADVDGLVALPAELMRSLAGAGLIRPKRSGATSYSMDDLLILRAAGALRAAKVPSRRIPEALAKLRAAVPPWSDLIALSTPPADTASATQEVVFASEGRAARRPVPWIIDLRPTSATAAKRREAVRLKRLHAEKHFLKALSAEDDDVAAARAGYIAALKTYRGHLGARINLGRLLHLNGELEEAERIYRQAQHASALLSFNLARLLEDLNRDEEAVQAYRHALALDPTLHDAHFNLSQLHERAGRPRESHRHALAYLRHARRQEN
jgi:tetratricopeptide (TPR) repeat protein